MSGVVVIKRCSSEKENYMVKAEIANLSEVEWVSHPRVGDAKSAHLYATQGKDKEGLTCLFSYLPPNTVVEKHTHEADEIIFFIKGQAIMHVEGTGEVPVSAGTFIRIPRGAAHYPYNITDELIAYNVFYPFLA